MELYTNLTPEEKLIKARIRLNKKSPFFSYLVMKLEFQEENEIQTIGVDKYGNCVYNSEWIKKLTDDNITYVLAHEVLHCALEHLIRVGVRDRETWNISGDAVINAILNESGSVGFVESGVNPNQLYDKNKKRIENVSSKTAEEIYDLIYDSKGNKNGSGFDKHIYDDS